MGGEREKGGIDPEEGKRQRREYWYEGDRKAKKGDIGLMWGREEKERD